MTADDAGLTPLQTGQSELIAPVPLARMRYTVNRAEAGEVSRYRVVAVNTAGLLSE